MIRKEIVMEYNKGRYYSITKSDEFKKFMEKADAADYWDAIEPYEWEAACEYAGLNLQDYDSPDALWEDLCEQLEYDKRLLAADEEFEKIKEESEPYYSYEEREAFELEMDSQRRNLALRYNVQEGDIN